MATSIRKVGSNNFGDSTYWSAGALASNDNMVIASGADDLIVGTDQNAKDFLSVKFDSGYGSDATRLGTGADGPLYFSVNQAGSGFCIFAGRCQEAWFKGGTYAQFAWAPRNPSAKLVIPSGTFTELHLEGGLSDISASAALTDVYLYGGTHTFRGPGSDTPNFHFRGPARVLLMRDYATINLGAAGKLDHDLAAPEISSPATGGTINLQGENSNCVLGLISGSLATLSAQSGIVDKTRLRSALTITTATYFPGATEKLSRNALTVTESSRTNKGSGPKYA